jgi:hypothetical protein
MRSPLSVVAAAALIAAGGGLGGGFYPDDTNWRTKPRTARKKRNPNRDAQAAAKRARKITRRSRK